MVLARPGVAVVESERQFLFSLRYREFIRGSRCRSARTFAKSSLRKPSIPI